MNQMSLAEQQRRKSSIGVSQKRDSCCKSKEKQKQMLDNYTFISSCLPDFRPIRKHESKMMDVAAFHLLTMHLPPLIKLREWCLLFSIERDGTNLQTFYQNVEDRDNTVLVIEDEHSEVFGAFMVE